MLAARADRNALVSALRVRRLDRTLTTALPVVDARDEQAIGSTGVPVLDSRLGGGLPRGHLSEIVGPRSSGRTSLLLHVIAAAMARGELVALVDALDMLDPVSAAASGIDLERLLWIRGHVVTNPGLCRDLNQRAMEQSMKALGLVLQAGNFGLVVFDVGDAPHDAIRRLPFTTWLRLQRMVEGSQTICVLAGNEPMSRSSAGLSIKLQPAGTTAALNRSDAAGHREARHAGRFAGPLFDGLDLEAQVARARVHGADTTALAFATKVGRHV
jgi:recombination protein RecA